MIEFILYQRSMHKDQPRQGEHGHNTRTKHQPGLNYTSTYLTRFYNWSVYATGLNSVFEQSCSQQEFKQVC